MYVDLSPLYQTLAESIISIGVAIIAVATYYIRKYALQKIDNEELRNSLELTLKTIEGSIKSAVLSLGDELKEALADGKLDEQEIEKLKTLAKKDVEEQISPALQKRLQAHVNDVNKFIEKQVEAELLKLQNITKG